MKVLYLNTAAENVKLGFITEDKAQYFSFKVNNNLAETLYDRIEEFLRKNKIKIKDLTHIAVFSGPGRFTGLRIGAVTVNAINFVQKTPLIGINQRETENLEKNIFEKIKNKEFSDNIIPEYGKEPNITSPR